MTLDRGRDIETKADALRRKGEYAEAGEYYSMAAFECFGDSIPSGYGETISFGQELLLESCLCFAVAGLESRRKNRANIGVLTSEDIIERDLPREPDSSYDRSRIGAWYEFIGDFILVGSLGDAREWYDRAEEVYRKNGNPETSLAEQEHLNIFTFFRTASNVLITDDREIEIPRTLIAWLQYKRDRLPTLLDRLDECDEGTVQ